ncbi:TRAP transporter large permease [Clostridium magnum]|uniref:Sialic acid TRAP transporter permease protein SiaT n=1 Tax=Clostridium magnum DSM 2767 TaxID=1121326 RepID=A0A161WDR5_9CLOT|nr:TRAP transporter large permease [Clostridium magnum]KZL89835.1 sialic acid TRAP transporter permease protein SiaT [Clostridium magnum DSM 2767]SHI70084.1 TRAP transporter, DctM subunit [Clostridium magnum DSM 2767]
MMTIFVLDVLLLVILLILGTPLPFVFGGGIVFMMIFADVPIKSLMLWSFNQMISPVLLASPFFMLAGSIIAESGIAKRLMDFANLFINRLKGGVGVLSVITCGILGAISGSSFTGIAAVGPVLIPEMEKKGYERGFATSLVTCSSILGVLIPPSIPLIIYGWVTGTSVLGSFLSTVGPGILTIITFSIINLIYARKRLSSSNEYAATIEEEIVTNNEVQVNKSKNPFGIFIKAIPGLCMPVIILGGIYGGVFTPTEAAAVASVLALFIGFFIYRELNMKKTYNMMRSSSISIGAIMTMITFCLILSQIFVMLKIPEQLVDIFMGITNSKLLVLVIVNIFLLFIGMIVNDTTAIILTAPLLLPLVVKFGISPIQFAAIMTVNLAAGGITPPYASVLYYGMMVGDCKFSKILKPTLVFLLFGYLPVIILTTYFEPVSMFLPRLFGF